MSITKSRTNTTVVRVRAMRDLTVGHIREFLEDCDKAEIPDDMQVRIDHSNSDRRLNEISTTLRITEAVE